MKSFASTLVLLVVVAGFGFYLWRNERGPIAESGSTVLLRTESKAVNLVQLGASGKTITLKRADKDRWTVSQKPGVEVAADAEAVDGLLKQLELVQSPSVMNYDAAKAKDYGLDKPASSVTVDNTTLQFGTTSTFDTARVYTRIGDRVAVLPSALSTAAAKPYTEWRDKTVLHAKPGDTTRLEVKTSDYTARFVKAEKASEEEPDVWKMEQPVATTAEATAIEGLLNDLSTSKGTPPPPANPYQPAPPPPAPIVYLEDKPESLAKWGLDKPLITLRATTNAGEQVLLIGHKTKGGYAAQNSSSPAVFEIPAGSYGLANRPLKDWRSKLVTDFATADLTRLDLSGKGRTLAYTRTADKWQAPSGNRSTNPADAGALNQAVLDLLIAVRGLNAQDFIDKPGAPASYGFDQPMLQFKASGGKTANLSIQIGSKDGRNYAQVGPNGSYVAPIYVISATGVDEVKKAFDHLLNPAAPTPTGAPIKPGP